MSGIFSVAEGRALLARLGARADRGLLFLLILPLGLLAFDRSWIVSTGKIDPWVYLGYYLNLKSHLQAFDGTYYGTRLSTILPGWLAYRVLPPPLANAALHLGLYYTSILSLYVVLKRSAGGRAALVTALCMGCNWYFLKAVGWDYVDGFGITYFLLTTLLLAVAARSRVRLPALLAAGAAAAAMCVANIFYLILLPFSAGFFLVANREGHRHGLIASALSLGAGAAALLALLGLVNYRLTGRFLFWLPSFHFALTLTQHGPSAWLRPLSQWLPEARWLLLPATCGVGALVMVVRTVRTRLREAGTQPVFFQAQLVLLWLLLLGLESRGRVQTLGWPFYASVLIPPTYLALGGQLGRALDNLRPPGFQVVMLALTALFLGSASLPVVLGVAPRLGDPLWSGVGLSLAAVGGVCLLRPRAGTALVAVGFLGLVNGVCCPPDPGYRTGPQLWRAVVESVRQIQAVDRSSNVWFWFSSQDPQHPAFDGVAGTYLWGYRLVNRDFPSLDTTPALPERKLGPDTKIVVLSSSEDALPQALAALRRHGLEARLLCRRRISQPPVVFTLTMLQTVSPPGGPSSPDGAHPASLTRGPAPAGRRAKPGPASQGLVDRGDGTFPQLTGSTGFARPAAASRRAAVEMK